MAIQALLKRNTYYDSITLMSVAQAVKDLPGVEDVGVVMATELNRELLHNSNLLPVAFLAKQETTPGPEDLLIMVRAIDEAHAEAALTVAEKRLTSPGDRGDSGAPVGVRAGTLVDNTSHLRTKGGETRQESSTSGILPERKNPRSFRCTDYAKWTSMTRDVNR